MPTHRPIVFRCDADPAIGLGHLARSSRIASSLRGPSRILLVGSPLGRGLDPWAAAFDEVRVVDPGAEQTFRVAEELRASALIVDGYEVVDECFRNLVDRGLSRVAIDDGPARFVGADLLLEPNLGSVADGYEVAPRGRVRAGAPYALLAPEIALARARQRPLAARAERILVTCGASDPARMTERFVEALAGLAGRFEVRVLVGPLNPRQDASIELSKRIGAEAVVGAASIEEHALWCDMALSCLGGTASELACLGVPNLAVAIHPKQVEHQNRYAELGLIVSLGWFEAASAPAIRRRVEEVSVDLDLRSRLREACTHIVDGLGAERVAGEIVRMTEGR
ncbi:MAG: hypothetical protein HYY06_21865 [Deltaproteobacteria bacterium]|nr:hypothetical protein [Deltaproteobacteria bacterium]